MIDDGAHSELIGPDRRGDATFAPLVEVIADELASRLSAGGSEAVEGARGLAEATAGAILDRFVVRPRPAESEKRRERRRIPPARA